MVNPVGDRRRVRKAMDLRQWRSTLRLLRYSGQGSGILGPNTRAGNRLRLPVSGFRRLRRRSAATENILLAARAHGLGSCWVAGDKKPYAAEICPLAGAPQGYRLVSLIPIGYLAESPEKSKRPLSDVLHWEKY
jgi:nitroreductase